MNIPVSEAFFNLPDKWFVGKKILDAGCGSIARNAINFCKLGATDITAMDLGEEWFEPARSNMENEEINPASIRLISGSVDAIPFSEGSFDFVCCDGVLPHLADIQQVTDSLNELSRITKDGGYLFVSWLAFGGLIETKICNAAREFYTENINFQRMVDCIRPEHMHSFFNYSIAFLRERDTPVEDGFINQLKELIDEDFCISIQNTLQCKKRESYPIDFISAIVCRNGFAKPVRLSRFVNRNNLRKYFAPFHYDRENEMSKILYGEGYVDCIFYRGIQ